MTLLGDTYKQWLLQVFSLAVYSDGKFFAFVMGIMLSRVRHATLLLATTGCIGTACIWCVDR